MITKSEISFCISAFRLFNQNTGTLDRSRSFDSCITDESSPPDSGRGQSEEGDAVISTVTSDIPCDVIGRQRQLRAFDKCKGSSGVIAATTHAIPKKGRYPDASPACSDPPTCSTFSTKEGSNKVVEGSSLLRGSPGRMRVNRVRRNDVDSVSVFSDASTTSGSYVLVDQHHHIVDRLKDGVDISDFVLV